MKDVVRSRRTILSILHERLVQRHPIIFNAILLLALIALIVAGAFLVSDIMSFKSKCDQKGHYSSLYLTISKESQETIKSLHVDGMKLMNQLKSLLGLRGSDRATIKNETNEDKALALISKNMPSRAKEVGIRRENSSLLQNPNSQSNSSRNLADEHVVRISSPSAIGAEPDGGSGSSSSSEGSSSDEGDSIHPTKVISHSHKQNRAPSKGLVKNEPRTIVPRNNNSQTINNLTFGLAFPSPQTNRTASNKTEIDESLASNRNDSVASAPFESDLGNSGSQHQNETLNLINYNNSIQREKDENKSQPIEKDRSKIDTGDSGSQINDSLANILPDNSNITSINKTYLNEIATPRQTILTNQRSSRTREPRQIRKMNKIGSEIPPIKSSPSLSSQISNKTNEVSNQTEKNSMNISSGASSAKNGSSINENNRIKKARSPSTPALRQRQSR